MKSNREYKVAVKKLNQEIEKQGDNSIVYLTRGIMKDKMGDTEGALRDLTKSIEIDPNYAKAYMIRGIINCKLSNYQETIDDYEKSTELGMLFVE